MKRLISNAKKVLLTALVVMLLGADIRCEEQRTVYDEVNSARAVENSYLASESNPHSDAESEVLWRIGSINDSNTEFGEALTTVEGRLAREVPTDWSQRQDWKSFPAALSVNRRGDSILSLTLRYQLPTLPEHGTLLTFKLLDASRVVPELAVYSNDVLAGLIQLWGTQGIRSGAGEPFEHEWKKTYRLYIPKELLNIGSNSLRLGMVRNSLSGSNLDDKLNIQTDYWQLSRLRQDVSEPIHGKMTYMGTTMRLGMHSFDIKESTLQTTPAALKWMGVAYSNNTVRADFWSDLSPNEIQTHRLEYLELLKKYNMTVVANHLNSAQVEDCGVQEGELCLRDRERLSNFFNRFGSLFQWMEIDNEPGLFERTLESNIAIANAINQLKPPHVKTAAPGWAFASWERDPENRRQIEALAETLNGHAYGESYNDYAGGSFVENLRAQRGVADGWPKEYITTEMGTNKHHSESFSGSPQPHAAVFDRITRAHIAVADRFMHHAFAFGDYGMFERGSSWSEYETLKAYPGVDGEENRLKTWRRLALAYATHGRPLEFVYTNSDEIKNKLVYFRAVDTSTLPPIPGSGATADKILLNFVNFSGESQRVQVRVKLPGCGAVTAERFGAGDVYSTAHSQVRLNPDPYLDLEEVLTTRESVQYIVDAPDVCPRA